MTKKVVLLNLKINLEEKVSRSGSTPEPRDAWMMARFIVRGGIPILLIAQDTKIFLVFDGKTRAVYDLNNTVLARGEASFVQKDGKEVLRVRNDGDIQRTLKPFLGPIWESAGIRFKYVFRGRELVPMSEADPERQFFLSPSSNG